MSTTNPDADLVIGAKNISAHCFGGAVTTRQVYRLFEEGAGYPIFKHLNLLAARPSAIRAEIERRERLAVEEGANESST